MTTTNKKLQAHSLRVSNKRGFTLLELVLVISLIAVIFLLVGFQSGGTARWKSIGFIQRMRDTIEFLYVQSITDQRHYRLEINFDDRFYRVGILETNDQKEGLNATNIQATAASLGAGAAFGRLTQELSLILHSTPTRANNFHASPTFPSLWTPVEFPVGLDIASVRNMAGRFSSENGGAVYITSSPRGFSEFAVIGFNKPDGNQSTILVNPFTGKTTLYDDARDFEWKGPKDSSEIKDDEEPDVQ